MGFERGVVITLLRHPLLVAEAMRSWFAMRRRGGLGSSKVYMAWRTSTAYGGSEITVSAQDVLNYLTWRRETRRIRKWEREA